MKDMLRIAHKEFASFFSSPIAFIFIGSFLAVILFVFFWVETFFARNIADVRPLFEWMPLLLIFLVAAITMRMWSEERRSGTLEFLLTSPVSPWQLVLGKFLACIGLVAVALALTLPIPITVSLIGPLDWGPVIGGYVATLFLAAAYTAIGLFVSARSANQIVSLIVTSLVCSVFYLLGSDALTGLFGGSMAELLKLLGTGSRFDSITRGVIDLRDLYYYLSLVGVFLALNVFTLEWLRWAGNPANVNHRRWGWLTGLLVANFVAANLWLAPLNTVRADLTAGKVYSISDATRGYLAQLQEPLLIRGYFSAKTHPLLAPLVPQLRDLLKEYAVAGGNRVRVEFIDPQQHPELEKEANEKYGIKPVPFQFASKYQSSVVNAYFNILVKYGDQYEVLGFRDLIDVKVESETDLEVTLRNPEYDITRAIKKALYAYQAGGDLFDNIKHPLHFNGYLSPDDKLPELVRPMRKTLDQALAELKQQAGNKLVVEIRDPDANGGALARQLQADYGYRPMTVSLLDEDHFWFYMTLSDGKRVVQIPLPETLDKNGIKRGIEAALKRFSTGFLKNVALLAPGKGSSFMSMGGKRLDWLRDTLKEEYNLIDTDLKDGHVPDAADLLLVVSPETVDDKQLFAIDQFLMQGGSVVLATAPFDVSMRGALSAHKRDNKLLDWLKHHGIEVESSMVLDPQNAAFPIPVDRRIGGFVVRETQMVDYPYFIDVRRDGIDQDSGLAAGIDQVTMTWASPIELDEKKNKGRHITPLLRSSDQSWTSDSQDIQPDFRQYGQLGFAPGDKRGRQTLAAIVEGRFESYFKDKPSPLAGTGKKDESSDESNKDKAADTGKQDDKVIDRVIGHSPDSARIILFASNSFLTDEMLDLAASGLGTRYLNPVELVQNAIDWSLEDRGLLALRGRAQYSRTLKPMDQDEREFWEYLNYALAVAGLLLIALIRHQARKRAMRRHEQIIGLAEQTGRTAA